MTDYEAARDHLITDTVLVDIVNELAVPKQHHERDPYYYLIESIFAQQVSFHVANIVHGRFLDLFENRIPDPKITLAMKDEQLRTIGLSRQKISYVKNASHFRLKGNLETSMLHEMDNIEVIKHLTQIKGVGKWTAEMVLMFPLDRPDVFPVDDLGIVLGIKKLYGLSTDGKDLRKEVTEVAERWKPFRTVACKYIWNNFD